MQSGTQVESLVADLFRRAHFEEFVFHSPKTAVGHGASEENELADVLLLVAGTLIITQVKMPHPDVHLTRNEDRRARWFRKARDDAFRQIRRTWSRVERGSPKPLRNTRIPEKVLRLSDIRDVVGVAVVGDRLPAGESPVIVEYGSRRIPSVTLGLSEFASLVELLDTPMDLTLGLVRMVEVAERVRTMCGRLPDMIGCAAAAASRAASYTREDEVVELAVDTARSRAFLDSIQGPDGLAARRRETMSSGHLFDSVLQQLHLCPARKAEVNRWVGDDASGRLSEWPMILEQFAALTRSQRAFYGEVYLDVGRRTLAHGTGAFRIAAVDDATAPVVFACSLSSEEERTRALGNLVWASWAVRRTPMILGVIWDPSGRTGGSHQFVLCSGVPPRVEGLPSDAQRLVARIRQLRSATLVCPPGSQ